MGGFGEEDVVRRMWREDVEGGCGGRMWRENVEGGCGEEDVEGGCG